LLRGRSPTRSVAPKQHRGLRRASLRHFGLAGGCRTIWRGELRFIGFGGARLLDRIGPPGCWPHDGEVAGGAVADLVLLISGPRVNLNYHPYARAGADGQAVVCPLLRGSSPPRGVAPKQHRGLRRAFSPWVPKNLARRNMASAGAMLLDRLGPPGRGRGWRQHDGEVAGGAVADLGLLISGPRVNLNSRPLRARGR